MTGNVMSGLGSKDVYLFVLFKSYIHGPDMSYIAGAIY